MALKILIVDDEPDVVELLSYTFRQEGYSIAASETGRQAVAKAQAWLPDLILLDLQLPEMDGFEVCKILRRDTATAAIPIIMVTARTSEIDRILGLEFGADDYVIKPFSPRELVLRVKNLLKRKAAQPKLEDTFAFGPLVVDIPRHQVLVDDLEVRLTATEFKLLQILAERRGRVQTREQLIKDVWGYDSLVDTRTVDTHMRRLRQKIGSAARYLDTVRNVGYRFVENPG